MSYNYLTPKSSIKKQNKDQIQQDQQHSMKQQSIAQEDSQINNLHSNKLIKQQFNYHSDILSATCTTLIGMIIFSLDQLAQTKDYQTVNITSIQSHNQFHPDLSSVHAFICVLILAACLCLIGLGLIKLFHTQLYQYLQKLSLISSFKKNIQYQNTKQAVQLIFEIECYHMQGAIFKRKVVTHKCRKIIELQSCVNLNNQDGLEELIKSIKKPYMFIQVIPKYILETTKQAKSLQKLYQQFLRQNSKDSFQDHRKIFKFKKLNQPVRYAYYTNYNHKFVSPLFVYLNILLIAWPAALILQLFVDRYRIHVEKSIKIKNLDDKYIQDKIQDY